MPQPQQDAVQTYIRYQVLDEAGAPRDISGAFVKQLIFQRPDKTLLTVDAGFYTNGTDGILQYITAAGDLNGFGTYQVQANLQMPGFLGRTEARVFFVNQNLPIP